MSVNVQGDVNISIDKDKGHNGVNDTASDKVSFWANIVQIVSGLCGIIKEHKAIAAVICVIFGTAGCAGINAFNVLSEEKDYFSQDESELFDENAGMELPGITEETDGTIDEPGTKKDLPGGNQTDDSPEDPSQAGSDEGKEPDDAADPDADVVTYRNESWSFVILDPNWEPSNKTMAEITDSILFMAYSDEGSEAIRTKIQQEYIEWNKVREPCRLTIKEKRKRNKIITRKEEFDSMCYDASKELIEDEWRKNVPTDKDYLNCAEGLIRISGIEHNGHRGSLTLYRAIANIFQKLAYESYIQGCNGNATLYYYLKSIEYAEKAMPYAHKEEEKKEQYAYIFGRFADIKMEKSGISMEYRKQAERVTSALQSLEPYM